MAQKLGRSGAGMENYDPETGRYTETATGERMQGPKSEDYDPKKVTNEEQQQRFAKNWYNTEKVKKAEANQSNYIDEKGTPVDYYDDVSDNHMEILKKASGMTGIPIDSIIEAYKNYVANKDVYGRSKFITMIKSQINNKIANINKDKYSQSLKNLGKNAVKLYNENYVVKKNQPHQEVIEYCNKVISNNNKMIKKLTLEYGKLNPYENKKEMKELEAMLKKYNDSNGIMSSVIKSRQKKMINPIKSIAELNMKYFKNPLKTLMILGNLEKISEEQAKEEKKAMQLLGTGGR